ncbi:hypothetical protein E0F91_03985 [Flavobacterium sandaracinum]|uniref:HEAT repeat domain-containing protein n=1 Tax=Flavobacterium sandaracinum TaxID=2541733 RepID=A0A4R5D179_9FLAO|nr:hypothetical protein E0F91_03985 [Flavobacterium sandaracinum]
MKRIHFEYTMPIRAALSDKVEIFLTEMILSNHNDEKLKKELLQFKKEVPFHKSWCKEMIINAMIQFKRNLKGRATEQINTFYQFLELDKYSESLISNYRSFYKCAGFYHFQALDYKKGSILIKPYLKNSNIVIRSNAYMAYISLTENYMKGLINQSAIISHLNLIKIMDILHEKKIPLPKNIDKWIQADNNSVVKLGLKIMVFFNYRNRVKEIIALTKREDNSVKIEAIKTIKELFLFEAKDELTLLFDNVALQVQLEILETLMVIGDVNLIPFLENIIQKTTNKDLKLRAVKCLNEISNTQLEILATKDFDINKMMQHAREIYL